MAFDVITINYGSSPISVISSVQAIEEERGNVYYRQVTAGATRGNVTTNDILMDPTAIEQTYPTTYAGDKAVVLLGTAGGSTTDTFSSVIPAIYLPLRKFKVSVNVADSVAATNYTLVDDGDGKLVGPGSTNANAAWGTVNYTSGTIVLHYSTAPSAGVNVNATISSDFAGSSDIPSLNNKLTTKGVTARVFALKETIGSLCNSSGPTLQ